MWSAVREYDGYAYPSVKLLAGVSEPWSIKALATTDIADPNISADSSRVQDSSLTDALFAAGEVPEATVERRHFATVETFQAPPAFNRAKALALGDSDPAPYATAREELVSSRWLGEGAPLLYHAAHVRLLLSDAHTSLRAGNPGDAAYPLTELEMMS